MNQFDITVVNKNIDEQINSLLQHTLIDLYKGKTLKLYLTCINGLSLAEPWS